MCSGVRACVRRVVRLLANSSPVLCHAEMASRVLKNRMRELMRQVLSAEEKDLRDVIATFLYRVLHDPAFWGSRSQSGFDVKRALKERFPACFYSDEVRGRVCV